MNAYIDMHGEVIDGGGEPASDPDAGSDRESDPESDPESDSESGRSDEDYESDGIDDSQYVFVEPKRRRYD